MNAKSFYRVIEHTADVGIEVEASDETGIFINCALAMFDLMYGIANIRTKQERKIRVEAESLQELLIAWLNELLYVYSVERLVFSEFRDAELSPGSFSAVAVGECLDLSRHHGDFEIKAATYHNLTFSKQDGSWRATVIFDV